MSEKWSDYFYKMNYALQGKTKAIVKEVLSDRTDKMMDQLLYTTPVRSGGLVNSMQKEDVKDINKVGFKIAFEGYDRKGRAYSEIANSLNKGWMANNFKFVIPQSVHFIDKALVILKGMDDEINQKWEEEIGGKDYAN